MKKFMDVCENIAVNSRGWDFIQEFYILLIAGAELQILSRSIESMCITISDQVTNNILEN